MYNILTVQHADPQIKPTQLNSCPSKMLMGAAHLLICCGSGDQTGLDMVRTHSHLWSLTKGVGRGAGKEKKGKTKIDNKKIYAWVTQEFELDKVDLPTFHEAPYRLVP